jgi:hypothetical protein
MLGYAVACMSPHSIPARLPPKVRQVRLRSVPNSVGSTGLRKRDASCACPRVVSNILFYFLFSIVRCDAMLVCIFTRDRIKVVSLRQACYCKRPCTLSEYICRQSSRLFNLKHASNDAAMLRNNAVRLSPKQTNMLNSATTLVRGRVLLACGLRVLRGSLLL